MNVDVLWIRIWNNSSQVFFKIGVFTNFTGKPLWWSLFLINLQSFANFDRITPALEFPFNKVAGVQTFRPATLLKRDSNIGAFRWNFRTSFIEHLWWLLLLGMSIFDLSLLFNLYLHTRYISYTIFLNDVEEGGELVFPLAKHNYKVRKYWQLVQTKQVNFESQFCIKDPHKHLRWSFLAKIVVVLALNNFRNRVPSTVHYFRNKVPS